MYQHPIHKHIYLFHLVILSGHLTNYPRVKNDTKHRIITFFLVVKTTNLS